MLFCFYTKLNDLRLMTDLLALTLLNYRVNCDRYFIVFYSCNCQFSAKQNHLLGDAVSYGRSFVRSIILHHNS
jgi:hypothetical protein